MDEQRKLQLQIALDAALSKNGIRNAKIEISDDAVTINGEVHQFTLMGREYIAGEGSVTTGTLRKI